VFNLSLFGFADLTFETELNTFSFSSSSNNLTTPSLPNHPSLRPPAHLHHHHNNITTITAFLRHYYRHSYHGATQNNNTAQHSSKGKDWKHGKMAWEHGGIFWLKFRTSK